MDIGLPPKVANAPYIKSVIQNSNRTHTTKNYTPVIIIYDIQVRILPPLSPALYNLLNKVKSLVSFELRPY